MKNVFKSLLKISVLGYVSSASIANANIINQNIIQQSCSKSYNKYFNCNFSNFTTQYLTNTKSVTLEMMFKVSYSRGKCANRFENGRYISDNFYLYLHSGEISKAILAGNNQTRLVGNSLTLRDLNPDASYATDFYSPCGFVIRKVEVDFSDQSKQQINEIKYRMHQSKNAFSKYKSVKENSSKLLISLNALDLSSSRVNLAELLSNLQQLRIEGESNLDGLITKQQMAFLDMNYKRLVNLSGSNNTVVFNRIAESIKKITEEINQNVYNKEPENVNDFSQSYNYKIMINTLLLEANSEPNFNQDSLRALKEIAR